MTMSAQPQGGDGAEPLAERLARLERENADLRRRLGAAEARGSHESDRAIAAEESFAALHRVNADQAGQSETLRANGEQLRLLADAIPLFVAFVDLEQRYGLVNRAYEAFFGRPREAIQGRTVRQVLGDALYEQRRPHIERALRGEAVRYEAPMVAADGSVRETEIEYSPRRDASGRVDGFYAVVADVTERRRAERTLRQSEARLRLSIDAGRMAIWEVDIAQDRLTVTPELNRLLGFPEDATPTVEDVRARYAPGERERLRRTFMQTVEAGQRYGEIELRYLWPDGSTRWLMMRAEIVPGPDGEPKRVLGVLMDVTERKRGEERQHLLLHEIAHRVKNTLATVLALATLTARTTTDVASYRDKLIDRVQGMAKTHDILTANNWEGASLRDVIANEVELYDDESHRRVTIEGPVVDLSPRAAVAVGMMAHELTTNAAKYGSLSTSTGRLDVRWSIDETGAVPRVELAWTERGGPAVVRPTASGFGSTLIQRGLARELEAEVAFVYAPEGLVFSLSMPLPPREAGLGLDPWSPRTRG
ncbi:sensor histidine kinase [Salinarimonas soli]|nr:sensor histidine kinase [Salinarimonas soli]